MNRQPTRQQQDYKQYQTRPRQGHEVARRPRPEQRPRIACPNCRSTNLTAQVVNEMELTTKRRSVLWWATIGFWWVPLKWIIFTVPALIVKIFAPKRYKTKNVAKTYFVCQDCGNTWVRG